MSFEQDHRIPITPEHELELEDELQYDKGRRGRLPGVLIGLVIAAVLMGGAFWWGYDLGRSGGYILAPCHNIGHDIPPENVVTLFEKARSAGDRTGKTLLFCMDDGSGAHSAQIQF